MSETPLYADPQRPTRGPLQRLLPRTLAGRLVAFVLALVLIVIVSFGVATNLALRHFLDRRLDQQLQAASETVAQTLFAPNPGGGPQSPQKLWFLPLDRDGAPMSFQTTLPRPDLSEDQIATLIAHVGEPRDVRAGGIELRSAAYSAQFQVVANGLVNKFAGYAILGLSTADLQETLNHLLLVELLIGAGVLLLASGLTAVGVQTGLRPLNRITRTARTVAAELSPEGAGLDRRVPQSDPKSEVGQLADSVNTMLEAMETQFAQRRANEERMRQFLADASHELRTPLTSIRGYAELARLQRSAGAAATDEGDRDVLDRIEAEGTRMSRLVADLLMLARSDRGVQPHFASFEVHELVDEALSGARAAHPARAIEAQVESFELIADRDQMLRVLRNLITNAVVHTAANGQITVSARTDGQWAWLSVADAGPGLDAEQSAHVFERFWRADKARVRARGGTGLGLAIVQAVMQAHGGTVQFASSVAEGTTVTAVLPVVAQPPVAWSEEAAEDGLIEDADVR